MFHRGVESQVRPEVFFLKGESSPRVCEDSTADFHSFLVKHAVDFAKTKRKGLASHMNQMAAGVLVHQDFPQEVVKAWEVPKVKPNTQSVAWALSANRYCSRCCHLHGRARNVDGACPPAACAGSEVLHQMTGVAIDWAD